MKKLVALLLILVITLNLVLLLKKDEQKADSEKALAFKMPKIDLNDVKPGILPGLLKF
jgi:hypothetical protein